MKNIEVSEAKRAELEIEIEFQKQRFITATQRGASALKTDLSILNWIRNYPGESAVLIMMTGYVATRLLQTKRQNTQNVKLA